MNEAPEDMEEEYDFSKMKSLGRGVYFERYWRSKGVRVLKPELVSQFPDDASVNEALSDYLRIKAKSA